MLKYHGYKTQNNPNEDVEKDVFLIINPVSGGGNARKATPEVIQEFERRNRNVEVYCTSGSQDVMSLTSRMGGGIAEFNTIAILSGDSTIMEFVQGVLSKNKGKWPYAPIMHLPGGTSNVVCSECFGKEVTAKEIFEMETCVKKGSVVQCSSSDNERKYAVHVAFTGFQAFLIDRIEKSKSGILYNTFGRLILLFLLLKAIISYHFNPSVPNLCSVFISDIENEGLVDMNFGISRFDKDARLVSIFKKDYEGIRSNISIMARLMKGVLGEEYKCGKVDNSTVSIRVTNKWNVKLESKQRFYFDGSNAIWLEGKDIDFEVLPRSIPYYVRKE